MNITDHASVSFSKILFDLNFFQPKHDNKENTNVVFLFQYITTSDSIYKKKIRSRKINIFDPN